MIKLKQQNPNIENYLKSTRLIDYESPEVSNLATQLGLLKNNEMDYIIKSYEYVRDKFPHTFDIKETKVSRSASDVIKNGHGICYAKSHLLAALLRFAGIPTGICYQRLCFDNPDEVNNKDQINKKFTMTLLTV